MKIEIVFDDGSFIRVEESPHRDSHVNMIMCGLNEESDRLTMSSSDLNSEQIDKLCEALRNIQKSFNN